MTEPVLILAWPPEKITDIRKSILTYLRPRQTIVPDWNAPESELSSLVCLDDTPYMIPQYCCKNPVIVIADISTGIKKRVPEFEQFQGAELFAKGVNNSYILLLNNQPLFSLLTTMIDVSVYSDWPFLYYAVRLVHELYIGNYDYEHAALLANALSIVRNKLSSDFANIIADFKDKVGVTLPMDKALEKTINTLGLSIGGLHAIGRLGYPTYIKNTHLVCTTMKPGIPEHQRVLEALRDMPLTAECWAYTLFRQHCGLLWRYSIKKLNKSILILHAPYGFQRIPLVSGPRNNPTPAILQHLWQWSTIHLQYMGHLVEKRTLFPATLNSFVYSMVNFIPLILEERVVTLYGPAVPLPRWIYPPITIIAKGFRKRAPVSGGQRHIIDLAALREYEKQSLVTTDQVIADTYYLHTCSGYQQLEALTDLSL